MNTAKASLLGSSFHAIIAAAFLFALETSFLDVELVENFIIAENWVSNFAS